MSLSAPQLPAEIIGQVLLHFSGRARTSSSTSLKECALVSRIWAQESRPMLFETLCHRIGFPALNSLQYISKIPHLSFLVKKVKVVIEWNHTDILSLDWMDTLTSLKALRCIAIHGLATNYLPSSLTGSIFGRLLEMLDGIENMHCIGGIMKPRVSLTLDRIEFGFCLMHLSILTRMLLLKISLGLYYVTFSPLEPDYATGKLCPERFSSPQPQSFDLTANDTDMECIATNIQTKVIDLSQLKKLYFKGPPKSCRHLCVLSRYTPGLCNLHLEMDFNSVYLSTDYYEDIFSRFVILDIPSWPNLRQLWIGTWKISTNHPPLRVLKRMLSFVCLLISNSPSLQVLEINIADQLNKPIPLLWPEPSPWTELDNALSLSDASLVIEFLGTYTESNISVVNLVAHLHDSMPLLFDRCGFRTKTWVGPKSYEEAREKGDDGFWMFDF
ncbi:hypothetical protein DL96DRAFT_1604659 [Flagelloscypha sp. PMI_526]|nr:hypothetical protein DL96DRAFT_1604659 [Flagelloscypha sp. PMI_526]